MIQTVSETAYAKVNLTLDITGRREDGYHTLDSIMQTVSLSDSVTLTYHSSDKRGIHLVCDNPLLSGNDNLCCKAADAFLTAANLSGRIEMTLNKRIPVAAGLGGGSADAAAVLRAMMRLFPGHLDQKGILELSAKLGADVPFCYVGGCMRARGIGDIMDELPLVPGLPFVIARRGEGISAAEAYRLYDATPQTDYHTSKALSALSAGDDASFLSSVSNGFEKAVFSVRPEPERLCDELIKLGAITSHMSGSGTAVFGIFSDEAMAKEAAERLHDSQTFAEVCYPCRIDSEHI